MDPICSQMPRYSAKDFCKSGALQMPRMPSERKTKKQTANSLTIQSSRAIIHACVLTTVNFTCRQTFFRFTAVNVLRMLEARLRDCEPSSPGMELHKAPETPAPRALTNNMLTCSLKLQQITTHRAIIRRSLGDSVRDIRKSANEKRVNLRDYLVLS